MSNKKHWKQIRQEMLNKKKKNIEDKIIKAYIDIHNNKIETKSIHNLSFKSHADSRTIKQYFGTLQDVDKAAREKYPNKFKDFPIEELLNNENRDTVKEAIKTHKTFIISTAVTGCNVHEKALKSVKGFCKKNKAAFLLLACSDPAHYTSKKGGYGSIDKAFQNELVITEDVKLNSNFCISTIKTTAKMINPLTGVARLGHKSGSFVYASPKQMLSYSATSNEKLPHGTMTTGAITKSNYVTKRYMSERLAYIADNDHQMGAIIVEIENDNIYHVRQVQFDKEGRFADYGIMYDGNKTLKYAPEAIMPGDWHSGETDPFVDKVIFDTIKTLKIKKVILNDLFNGQSINPHEKDNLTLRSQRFREGKLCLETELKHMVSDLNRFSKIAKEVVVVRSNHDDFLDRYLQSGGYIQDVVNYRIGLTLAGYAEQGFSPLQKAFEVFDTLVSENIKWLKIDEDYKIAGIQLGSHGHKGPNGSRGSLRSMESSYGKSITGHSHTPGILRQAWAIGTSTPLKLQYNAGPSSWLQTFAFVYPNGMRQLINIINGKTKL